MSYYIHIDQRLVAIFEAKSWAEKFVTSIMEWESSIDHLPHRKLIPPRHVILTDKDTGDVIFDSVPVPVPEVIPPPDYCFKCEGVPVAGSICTNKECPKWKA
jgi:hypothetical protein